MSNMFSFIFHLLRGGSPWGTVRLPDGRGIFFPWRNGVAYLVPSDEIYHEIRRKMILWKIIFVLVGMFLGPVVLMLLVKYFGLWEVTESSIWVMILICLFLIILFYVRWATKITRNLKSYTGQDLDPTKATSYVESTKRNIAVYSTFFFYCTAVIGVAVSTIAIYIVVADGWSWLAVLILALGLGSFVSSVNAIRLKRIMPKQDFFK
jgi:MFS family permease